MKITILWPKSDFTKKQQEKLKSLGQIVYTDSTREYPISELIKLTQGSTILGFAPENVGGFEVARERLSKLLYSIPSIKGLALQTTSFNYVDLNYCKKRKIIVTNVPHYSTESVAEHTLAYMLCCAKRIFLSEREIQKNEFKLQTGIELRGKTLGIIGLGSIGSRVAELGLAIGMKVIAWNRTPKIKKWITMRSLDQVLSSSDIISLHLRKNDQTERIISKEKISKFKKGIIVINTANRDLVEEKAMAKALKLSNINSYVVELDDINSPPLNKIENAFLFKGYGWYTKDSTQRMMEIFTQNIIGLAKNKPLNTVI